MGFDEFTSSHLLALYTKLRSGRCLTHVGREGALVSPRAAHAATHAKAIVVLSEGSTAAAAALRAELGDTFTVSDSAAFRASLGRWSKANLVGALAEPRRDDFLDDLARAAQAQRLDAIVLLEMRTTRRGRTARLVLIDVASARSPFETEVTMRPGPDAHSDAARLRAAMAQQLLAVNERGDSAPLRTSELVAPEQPAPASPAPRPLRTDGDADTVVGTHAQPDKHDLAHAIIVLDPHVAVGMRHFDYVDRVSPGQRPYALGAAPMIGFAGAFYPFAFIDNPVLQAVGIVGGIGQAVALQSALANGERVDTSWSHYDVALRARLAVSDRLSLGAKTGYGVLDYSFGNAGTLANSGPAELPNVTYRYIEMGADGRFEVWKIALMAGVDYLAVQSAAGVAARYPHATIGGIEAMAGIAVPFVGHFEARTGVRYQRFFYSMHPQVGEAHVAGGALDEYGRWDAGLGFFWN